MTNYSILDRNSVQFFKIAEHAKPNEVSTGNIKTTG